MANTTGLAFLSLLAGLILFSGCSNGWSPGTALFECAAYRWQAAPTKKEPAAPASLKLELTVQKVEITRGESNSFELTLTNTGTDEVLVDDGAPRNQAFSIRIAGGSTPVTANAMSMAIREGERVNPPVQPSRKALQPGEKILVQGDLAAWVGALSPGEYTVSGGYTGSPKLNATSNRIALRVTQSLPVYEKTAGQNFPLPQQTRDTAWINRTDSGYDLFLLQASPKNPDVAYSNRRIATLASPEAPTPSSYNTAPPKIQHVVWASADGNLHIVRVPRGAPADEPAGVPLPDKDLKPVDSPYTDPEGILSLVLANPDGKNAGLFQVPAQGKPLYSPIEPAPPISAQREVQWSKDETLFLAWLSADSKEIYAATAQLSEVAGRIVPRRVFTSSSAIANLALSQRYSEARQAYEFVLVILGLDRSREMLQVRRLDARTGKVESDERFTLPGLKGMTFFKSALREDLTPVYSFLDAEGGLWIAQPRLSRLTPVSDGSGAPVTKECYPELVLPARTSKLPGVYIRFIDGGRRLAVVKVGQ